MAASRDESTATVVTPSTNKASEAWNDTTQLLNGGSSSSSDWQWNRAAVVVVATEGNGEGEHVILVPSFMSQLRSRSLSTQIG